MKLTIIPSDGVVGVDRVFRSISMAGIDPAIHSIQFEDATNSGEIEYKERGRSPDVIMDRAAFQPFIDRWTAAAPLPPPPPTPEELAEQARQQAIKDDALRIQLVTRLTTATNLEISNYVDVQVTDLASARTMFKRILLILALIVR